MTVFYGLQEYCDPRQIMFRRVINSDAVRAIGTGTSANTAVGFPASYVDIGWICERADKFWRDNPHITKEEFSDVVVKQLWGVVQRTKYLNAELDGDSICVKMKTKDDFGWYCYEFSIHLSRRRLTIVEVPECSL